MAELTIAKLAREAGVTVETVRYYQRRGLLDTPARDDATGRIRRYGDAHVRRLRFIRAAQAAGFTLSGIGELLALDATQDRARVRALATARLAALDTQIAELTSARASLDRLATMCGEAGGGPCPILAAFDKT